MTMLVRWQLPTGFQVGQQVQDLFLRERVEQADRHCRGTLRLPLLDAGFF